MRISSETLASLERLARLGGSSLPDVIAKAFILYETAADASRSGKAVGIASHADILDVEFVGF